MRREVRRCGVSGVSGVSGMSGVGDMSGAGMYTCGGAARQRRGVKAAMHQKK